MTAGAKAGPDLPRAPQADRRSGARLAAVQALYQIELGGGDPGQVIAEFFRLHDGPELNGAPAAEADPDFFRALAQGTIDRLEEVDQVLAGALENRTVGRLDATLRALLRAGAFELMAHGDVPARVAINEYLDLAHAFFSGAEPGLVNGVLDRIARDLRADELG